MLLRLQKYSLKVQYCPVKEMYIADMLSRAYLHEQTPTSKGEFQIFQLQQEAQLYKENEEINPAKHVRFSEDGLATIRETTLQDDTLTELTKVIQQGWPDLKQNVLFPYMSTGLIEMN